MLLLEAGLLMGLRPTTCHPDWHSTSQSERQLLGGACVHKNDMGLHDMDWQTGFTHHPAGLHPTSVSSAACPFADTYYAEYQHKGRVGREHVQVSAVRWDVHGNQVRAPNSGVYVDSSPEQLGWVCQPLAAVAAEMVSSAPENHFLLPSAWPDLSLPLPVHIKDLL